MIKITKCPNTPNCVSSIENSSSKKYIEPFKIKNNVEISKLKIKDICLNKFKAEVETEESNYLHFIFRTKFLNFKDDIEFEFLSNKINVKSASRIGYSDLGVNRRRINKIRRYYEQ